MDWQERLIGLYLRQSMVEQHVHGDADDLDPTSEKGEASLNNQLN